MQDEYLSISEAAHKIGVSIATLRNWDNQKKWLVPDYKLPTGRRLYSVRQVENFIINEMRSDTYDDGSNNIFGL